MFCVDGALLQLWAFMTCYRSKCMFIHTESNSQAVHGRVHECRNNVDSWFRNVFVIMPTDTLKLLSYYIRKINNEDQEVFVSQELTDS
jgi:hypothetical protein